MFNNSGKERRSSAVDNGFAVFQNGNNGRNKERPSVPSSAAPAASTLHFRGAMDNSTYPDDGAHFFPGSLIHCYFQNDAKR
jgi:hypothetical protein